MHGIEQAAKRHNVTVEYKGNGHYQLKGKLLVHYYPSSKNRTAYVDGTTQGKKHVLLEDALKMCNEPPNVSKKDKRSNQIANQKHRKRLLKKSDKCYWCGRHLTFRTSTLEHIIPLALGGLNNANNMTLACKKCNQNRGCEMPELTI